MGLKYARGGGASLLVRMYSVLREKQTNKKRKRGTYSFYVQFDQREQHAEGERAVRSNSARRTATEGRAHRLKPREHIRIF